MMARMDELSVLVVEDDQADAELLYRTVEPYVQDMKWRVVSDEASLEAALQEGGWDVALCDWGLVGFSGKHALEILRERLPELPVLLVTGSLKDTDAALAASSGAVDYLLKDRLGRLPLAIRDAIHRRVLSDAKAELDYISNHDSLTQLHNRTALQNRLRQTIVHARKLAHGIALVHIDLDRFRSINDSFGQDAGDHVLRTVAARLRDCVRTTDMVARYSDDEFGVLVDQVHKPTECIGIIKNMLDRISEPIEFNQHELYITATAGVAFYPQDGQEVQALVRSADIAMHRAIQTGTGKFEFFSEEMSRNAYDTLVLANSLRGALDRGEMFIEYQPQVNLASGYVTGVEALVRWRHPERGLVSPAEFIPMAEESGLINAIGDWVLETACRQTHVWRRDYPDLRVAVNVSARQLAQPDLALRVGELLEDIGLSPDALQIELTESSLMTDAVTAESMLESLKALGIVLAIDDFGTGYSSLSYLKLFPADILKIDRAFVKDLPDDPDDVALVKTIIAVARTLDMHTTAEGVETAEQRAFLRREDCDDYQGYLFSHPLPPDELKQLLDQREPGVVNAIRHWFGRWVWG